MLFTAVMTKAFRSSLVSCPDIIIIKREHFFFQREFHRIQGTQERRADGTLPSCPWTCELTNDAGYVVYSALGSFYIPMLVMLFFYWRIYRAAVRTTRAINQGFKTTKGNLIFIKTHDFINISFFVLFPRSSFSFISINMLGGIWISSYQIKHHFLLNVEPGWRGKVVYK